MSPPQVRPDLRLLAALYLFEVGVLVAALAAYRTADRGVLTTNAGRVGLVATIVAVAAAAWLGRAFFRARKAFLFTLGLNLVSVVLAAAAGEVAVRALAVRQAGDLRFSGTVLLPRSWPDVAASWRERLGQANPTGNWTETLLVHDPDLGWTVGPDRTARDGMYYSSAEGIRCGGPGETLRDRPPGRRVALVGDSFTFGKDVSHEESWAHRLQEMLGPELLVLNFGVDGYGVDQAYLRYLRDARAWKPEIVLFGVIQHDFIRTMAVYAFLGFPTWGFPFAKPRFVLRDGVLERLGDPVPSPEEFFSMPRIADLPWLDHESGYDARDWTPRWYHGSHLLRFLLSRFRAWRPTGEGREAMESVNVAILRAFLRQAREDGATPRILYFPTNGGGDFTEPARGFVRPLLVASGIDFVDLTEPVRRVPASERYVPGAPHYSARTNEAVARHLHRVLAPAKPPR